MFCVGMPSFSYVMGKSGCFHKHKFTWSPKTHDTETHNPFRDFTCNYVNMPNEALFFYFEIRACDSCIQMTLQPWPWNHSTRSSQVDSRNQRDFTASFKLPHFFFSRFRLIFIKLWLYLWPLMNITPFRCISLPKLLQTIAVEMLCRLNQLTKKTHAAVLHVWPRKWNVSSLQPFVNKTDLNDVRSSIIYVFHVKSTKNYYTHQSYGFTDVRFQTNTHHYKMLCYELLSGGHNFVQNMNDFVNRRGYNHRRGGWTFLRNYK